MNTRRFDLADLLAMQVRALKLPEAIRDYQAIPHRKFACDLAWVDRKLCIEVDGGELIHGRHSRAAGMASDCEKQNLLVMAGWKTLRFVGSQVRSGAAIAFLERWFTEHP